MSQYTIPNRTVLAVILAALAMLGPFCIDAIFPAFPAISAQFNAGALAMQQTISVYLFAYAALSLFVGAFSDAWGRRRVILVGLLVFMVATAGCALSNSMQLLLLFRALQGMSAGVGLIVGRAIVRDCFDGHLAQKLMAQISMIFGIAPAIAPVVGAFLVAWGSWHTLFWMLVLFTALLLLLCAIVLPETHPRQDRHAFSPRNLWLSYRTILTDSQFVPLATAITFNSGGFFLYIACAPSFVLSILKLDQNQFPWLFVPAISGLVLGALIAGRVAGRVTMRVLVGSGYTIILGAAALNVLLASLIEPARVPWLIVPIFLAGIGVNLASPTINLLVLDRFPRYRGAASSVQAFVQLSFSALLAGALGPLLSSSALHMALASGALYLLGFLAWRWYRLIAKRMPTVDPVVETIMSAASS